MKFAWVVVSAVLLWSNLRKGHAQPIMSDSMLAPLTPESMNTSDPGLVMMESENEPNAEMTMDEMPETMQPALTPTQSQSDGVEHSTSSLSVEASSLPSMSVTMQITMSMRSQQQRRIGIVTGGLAGGIMVLMFASILAVLCQKALQRRRKRQGRNGYMTKDHGIDDYDDNRDGLQEPHQDGNYNSRRSSQRLSVLSTTTDNSSVVQSFDAPPSYTLATLHRSLGPGSAFCEVIITSSSNRGSITAPPAYGPPGYGDVVLEAR